MQDLEAIEGNSLSELREIAKVLGINDPALKKKELLARIVAFASGGVESTVAEESKTSDVETAEPKRRGRRPCGNAPQRCRLQPRLRRLRACTGSSQAVPSGSCSRSSRCARRGMF